MSPRPQLLPLLALGLCACSFDTSVFAPSDFGDAGDNLDPSADSGAVDAGEDTDAESAPDAAVDPADAAVPCPGDDFGFEFLNIESCDVVESDVSINVDFDQRVLSTEDGILRDSFGGEVALPFELVTQVDGPELMVISVANVQVNQFTRFRVAGPRGLVLISHGDIDIDGRLLANARGRRPGPGGNAAGPCAGSTGASGESQDDDNGNSGGSGGGGGGFGSSGGDGAAVADSNGLASSGGSSAADLDLVPLRGGCGGGEGGRNGGLAGGGGGALQLIAKGSIRIDGAVSVSGGGATGVDGRSAGGAGGGSGGGLLLQANQIEINGIATANGGGGSEGSRGGTFSDSGDDGHDDDNGTAAGGSGFSFGGNGGNGAAPGEAAGNGGSGDSQDSRAAGSGGGGGGVGVIRIEVEG